MVDARILAYTHIAVRTMSFYIHIHSNEFLTLEESLSITTLYYNLGIATHARKMHKKIFVVVHMEVLDND